MKRVLPLMLLFAFCGVDECNEPPKTVEKADPVRINYIRDDRTNLCFARWRGYGEDSSSIAHVPCQALINVVPGMVESYK